MSEKKTNLENDFDPIAQAIEKEFGKGSIFNLNSDRSLAIETISSGSLALDLQLGGGLPKGRIVEIYGPASSGKTTLTLHCIKEVQARGGNCVFVDAEHALDPAYAKVIGVNLDKFWICQPDSGEQALNITERAIRSGKADVIVVDSVAALVPMVEIEGDVGKSHMAIQARMMSQAMRKFTAILGNSKSVLIFINQLRDNVGGYGEYEVTTGGKALKFYASIRIDIRRREGINDKGEKDKENPIGNITEVKVVKNKIAPPFRKCTFNIIYGEGISRIDEVVNIAIEKGFIVKSGSWYSTVEGKKLGQGKENVKGHILENNLSDEIINKVFSKQEIYMVEPRVNNRPPEDDPVKR